MKAEFRGRYSGAQNFLGGDVAVLEREAPERGPQRVERQTQIEQGAQHHVARGA